MCTPGSVHAHLPKQACLLAAHTLATRRPGLANSSLPAKANPDLVLQTQFDWCTVTPRRLLTATVAQLSTVTEATWPAELKLLVLWPFPKNHCQPLCGHTVQLPALTAMHLLVCRPRRTGMSGERGNTHWSRDTRAERTQTCPGLCAETQAPPGCVFTSTHGQEVTQMIETHEGAPRHPTLPAGPPPPSPPCLPALCSYSWRSVPCHSPQVPLSASLPTSISLTLDLFPAPASSC